MEAWHVGFRGLPQNLSHIMGLEEGQTPHAVILTSAKAFQVDQAFDPGRFPKQSQRNARAVINNKHRLDRSDTVQAWTCLLFGHTG